MPVEEDSTVLDETRECNKNWEIDSKHRLCEQGFQPYHSLIEMCRYAVRFMHQLHLIRSLRGILRTKYDQYNSLIRPLEKYLADHGVNFVSGATMSMALTM